MSSTKKRGIYMDNNKINKLSIRNKFFINMVLLTLLCVIIVTAVALVITYATMKQQVIDNYNMSASWLQSRLEQVTKNYSEKFYGFEVDKVFRKDINSWYEIDGDIDYSTKLRLIAALNKTISMDSTINSIEVHNLSNQAVLITERAKAYFIYDSQYIESWKKRDASKQSNLVISREDKEIVVTHQMNRFSDNAPLALVVIRIRPYELQEILETIRTNVYETIYIINESDMLVEQLEGKDSPDKAKVYSFVEEAGARTAYEVTDERGFWFYRSVNSGKLKIVKFIPNKTILSALKTTLLGGVFAAFLSILISMLFSLIFSHIISRPIVSLANEIRMIDLDDDTPHIRSEREDEIGFLQESFNIMVTRNRDLVLKEYRSEINRREAQIRALQAQINPHFMYNTLQMIGGMALKKDAKDIYSMTLALSDLMRYSQNFSKEMVCLRDEITYLYSYLMIQNQRFSNRIHFEVEADHNVLQCMVPKLILQPLVENCFEHGLAGKKGQWHILLKGELLATDELKLTVTDNGVGIPPPKLDEIRQALSKNAENVLKTCSHIGLCNVNSRIKLKSSKCGHGVMVESAVGEGTKITVLMDKIIEERNKTYSIASVEEANGI